MQIISTATPSAPFLTSIKNRHVLREDGVTYDDYG